MKKTDLILLLAVGLYSGLFYEQQPGINFLIFTIAILGLSIIHRKQITGFTSWRIAAVGAIISAVCIAWHGNLLSLIANAISLSLVSKLAVNKKSSAIAAIIVSFISVFTAWYYIIINRFARHQEKDTAKDTGSENSFPTRMLIFGIPVIIVVVFVWLYRASNPVFDLFVSKINLDFISLRWVVFTISGWFIMYSFFFFKDIKKISGFDINASGTISQDKINPQSWLNKLLSVDNENVSGIVLFGLLNLLLLIVNLLDINYSLLGHILGNKLPKGITHSQIVHQGVDALIWSIILAVGIILHHFRGRLNFFENNKTLKMLAYLWIAQNIFMVFSTGARNFLYISNEGITAKRIGVYFYLGLCIAGLLFTFIKILKKNTNWQLVRQVSWVFYGVLVLSCFINWEAFITDYNVEWQGRHGKTVDGGYFISLNTIYLDKLADLRKNNISNDSTGQKWTHIDEKIREFMSVKAQYDWRSWTLDNARVMQKLDKLSRSGKIESLYLHSLRYDDFKAIAPLNLKMLSLQDGGIGSFEELAEIKTLEELDFKNFSVSTFSGIENLKNLKILKFDSLRCNDYSALAKLSNIQYIYIKNQYDTSVETIKQLLPNTKIIKN